VLMDLVARTMTGGSMPEPKLTPELVTTIMPSLSLSVEASNTPPANLRRVLIAPVKIKVPVRVSILAQLIINTRTILPVAAVKDLTLARAVFRLVILKATVINQWLSLATTTYPISAIKLNPSANTNNR
jgi:hypothetical protein